MGYTKPMHVTFTGIDDQTSLTGMLALSALYPIEWGVLAGGRLGKNRYPSMTTIANLALVPFGRRAIHLCGAYAQKFNAGRPLLTSLPIQSFHRVQVNRPEGAYDITGIKENLSEGQTAIIQHRAGIFPPPMGQIEFLHDRSGGKGLQTMYFPVQQNPKQFVGFAGGFNPENVASRIHGLTATNYWIDMESGIRDGDDWLDLKKCEAVCQAIWGESAAGFTTATWFSGAQTENSDVDPQVVA